ncbi:MAG: hypothetical protein AAB965_03530 [Patescibacteria group bacterium]
MTQEEFEKKGIAYAERLLVHWQDEGMVIHVLMIGGIQEDNAREFLAQAKMNLAQVNATEF